MIGRRVTFRGLAGLICSGGSPSSSRWTFCLRHQFLEGRGRELTAPVRDDVLRFGAGTFGAVEYT